MKYCPACKAEMDDAAKFCLVCGRVLSEAVKEDEPVIPHGEERIPNPDIDPPAADPAPDWERDTIPIDTSEIPREEPAPAKKALFGSFRKLADRVKKKLGPEYPDEPDPDDPEAPADSDAPEAPADTDDPKAPADPAPEPTEPEPAAPEQPEAPEKPAPEAPEDKKERDLKPIPLPKEEDPDPEDEPPAPQALTTGKYFFLEALFAVPVVGTVFLFIFSLGKPKNDSLRRFSASLLIWRLIIYILLLAAFAVFMLRFREWAPAVLKFLDSLAPAAGH